MYAIKAGSMMDGKGGDLLQDGVILFEGKNITAVGPAANVEIPSGAEIIDAAGKTVMPGLIDAHVHMIYSSAALDQQLFTPKAVAYYKAMETLQRTLRAGFTTVRDAGGANAGMRQAIEMGLIAGPRLVVSGRIGQTGGLMEMWFPSGTLMVDEDSWRVCDGDPLSDITVLQDPERITVYKQGMLVQ